MRRIIQICAAGLLFAACHNPKTDLQTKQEQVSVDTTGMYKSNGSTDTSTVSEAKLAPPPPQVKTVTRTVYVDRPYKAPRRNAIHEAVPTPAPVQAPVVVTPPPPLPGTQTSGNNANNGSGGNGNQSSNGNGGYGNGTYGNNTGTTTTKQRDGWSKAAQGAAIGGVGGAIGGAILSRKKGQGAVIGGIIGAAGGYIIGRKKDKQDTSR